MNRASEGESPSPLRRSLLGAALGGVVLAVPAALAAAEAQKLPPLQEAYSTDPYMTCDALEEEIARMGTIIVADGTPPDIVKTAQNRARRLRAILKSKESCEPAPPKEFGRDMYDLPGTAAPPRR